MVRTRQLLGQDRTWIVLAYFGLAGVVVALYFHQTEISRQEAARQAADHAKVSQCVQSIPQLRKINRFAEGVKAFHVIVARNARAIVESTPRSDPQYAVRVANYRRILATIPAVSGVHFHIPTVSECELLGSHRKEKQ